MGIKYDLWKGILIKFRLLESNYDEEGYEGYIRHLRGISLGVTDQLTEFFNFPTHDSEGKKTPEEDIKFVARIFEDSTLILNYDLHYLSIYNEYNYIYKKYCNSTVLRGIEYKKKQLEKELNKKFLKELGKELNI